MLPSTGRARSFSVQPSNRHKCEQPFDDDKMTEYELTGDNEFPTFVANSNWGEYIVVDCSDYEDGVFEGNWEEFVEGMVENIMCDPVEIVESTKCDNLIVALENFLADVDFRIDMLESNIKEYKSDGLDQQAAHSDTKARTLKLIEERMSEILNKFKNGI